MNQQYDDMQENVLPESYSENEKDKLTLLEGMKILFDERVGLSPVQVVEKRDRGEARN